MGRFPIAVLLGAFVPVWAYEKCGMDVHEVGLLQTSSLSPVDLARARKVIPGPQFLAAHSGNSNELLNQHLLRITSGKAKQCEDFTHRELDDVLEVISSKVHHVLQSIYENNEHPDDEDWKDPRGQSGAWLSENTEIPPELMDLAQFEKKCYDAAMAFTHSVSDRDKQEILVKQRIPLLPLRPAHATEALLQEGNKRTAGGETIFESSCAACHSGGVNSLKTFQQNVDIVAKGKGSMPGFANRLSQKEMEEVAQFVMDQSEQGW